MYVYVKKKQVQKSLSDKIVGLAWETWATKEVVLKFYTASYVFVNSLSLTLSLILRTKFHYINFSTERSDY